MENCQMPQGHPTRCGCGNAEPDRYASPDYCRSLEQERDFLRNERDSWAAKWQKAVSYGSALELQRDALLAALDSMMRDTGLVDLMRPDQIVRNRAALARCGLQSGML
jgi:hypothetical protein